MATLSAASRRHLKPGQFAGPDHSYPIPDHLHAANAKGRAAQAVKAGRMSPSQAAVIKAKANKVLKRTSVKTKKRPDSLYEAVSGPTS